jgi:hypothetical protein
MRLTQEQVDVAANEFHASKIARNPVPRHLHRQGELRCFYHTWHQGGITGKWPKLRVLQPLLHYSMPMT